jgi:hypothetical protein
VLEKRIGGGACLPAGRLVAAAAFAVLAAGIALLPLRAVAEPPTPWPAPGDGDVSIHVETRAVVVGLPQVTIDIEPGWKCNLIILGRFCLGVVPVAILTTPQFDATTVDPHTVRFAGAPAMWWKAVDVDHDGDKDLLLTFRTKQTNLAPGDTKACLHGETFDHVAFDACDSVHIIGLDRWWKVAAAAASITRLDGGAGGNVSEGTGLTAALGASSGPVAPPPAGSSGVAFWGGDGWPWWAGLALGVVIGAFILAGVGWALGAKRRNGSAGH